MIKHCKACGQRLREQRGGVWLSPLKARIYDLIAARPGITGGELSILLDARNIITVRVHVGQINAKLDQMRGYRIRGGPYGYHLIKLRDAA